MRKLWNLLCSNSTWYFQFLICSVGSVLVFFFLFINYYVLPSPVVCYHEPYSPWIKDYIFLILGAGIGQTGIQYWRVITSYFFVEGSLRHPLATIFIILIFSFYSIHLIIFYFDIFPYTCVSFFGLKTPPSMWVEAIALTPMQFFLANMLDVKKSKMSNGDLYAQCSVIFAFFIIFFMNAEFLPRWAQMTVYFSSMFIMFGALYWIICATLNDYKTSKEDYELSLLEEDSTSKKSTSSSTSVHPAHESNDSSGKHTTTFLEQDQISYRKEVYDRFHVAGWRMIALAFNIVIYIFYYGTFHLVFLSADNDLLIVLVVYYSFFLKMAYFQIIGDSHIEILDPNKFLLIEERKKFDESRMMFFRYVFHEIRVPLNAVSLGLQLLSENEELMHFDEDTVETMKDATLFMSQTLNDVISLQKLEQGTLQIEHTLFDPRVLINLVLSNFRAQYEAKEIKVSPFIEENVPKAILGDQFRLEHVLANLLSNAIKFSDMRTSIEIHLSYGDRREGFVCFTVKDYGIGMTAEEQKSLFQPFQQIRPGELQKGKGSGLGLSICKMMMDLHEGFIGVESKKREVVGDPSSGGSEFYFGVAYNAEEVEEAQKCYTPSISLKHMRSANISVNVSSSVTPLKPADALKFPSSSPTNSSPNSSSPVPTGSGSGEGQQDILESDCLRTSENDRIINSNVNVLICDDVLSNRKMLQLILQRKGFNTTMCNDGKEAVEMVKTVHGLEYFDMIFMDNLMPNMCGPDASRALRAMGYHKLIIGVTGSALDTDIQEFESAGADLVLPKPMNMTNLNNLLEYCSEQGFESHNRLVLQHQHVSFPCEQGEGSSVKEESTSRSSTLKGDEREVAGEFEEDGCEVIR